MLIIISNLKVRSGGQSLSALEWLHYTRPSLRWERENWGIELRRVYLPGLNRVWVYSDRFYPSLVSSKYLDTVLPALQRQVCVN